MEKDIIIRLLKGEHISVQERIEKKIQIHKSLNFEELVDILSEFILANAWFPYPLELSEEGKAVQEAGFIENVGEKGFIYYQQRAYATNPYVVAERIKKNFKSAEDIARFYLKNALHLPGDLDGFRVQ
jgi:hypothetical protein